MPPLTPNAARINYFFLGLFTFTVWSLLRLNERLALGVLSWRLLLLVLPPLDKGRLWSISFPLRSIPSRSYRSRACSRFLLVGNSFLSNCCWYSFWYGRGLFTYGTLFPSAVGTGRYPAIVFAESVGLRIPDVSTVSTFQHHNFGHPVTPVPVLLLDLIHGRNELVFGQEQ